MLDPKLPDPGPPPYCPKCGGKQIAGIQGIQQGVCVSCGTHVKPVVVEGQLAPFLEALSDLAVHPPQVQQLAQQVRAKIRQEDEMRRGALRRERLA